MVWRAHDEVLDRPVAVKLLARVADESLRRRLRSEAQACGRLNHPHIAQVYDYGEATEGSGAPIPYIVMELVDGEALSRRLGGSPLDWPVATALAGQIADALRAAHARGLVHRDVKPDNVIITDDGVKLVDFGISATIGAPDAEVDGELLGTPAYVAPERLEGAPVGPAADMYAFGVLLYRMLSGGLPWVASSNTELIEAHLEAEPALLPHVDGLPEDVAELCMACMRRDPDLRPTGADAVRVLAAAASDAPATSAVSTPVSVGGSGGHTRVIQAVVGERGGQLASRSRRRFAMILAGGAATLLAAAWVVGDAAPPAGAAGNEGRCDATFSVIRDTGSEFTADLRVANVGRTAIDGWQLTFTFPGSQTIQADPVSGYLATVRPTAGQPYLAMLAQSGPTVVARTDGTQALAPGAAATFGIRARYRGANALPTEFGVNGQACQARIAGATTPGVTGTPPATTPAGATTAAARDGGNDNSGDGGSGGKNNGSGNGGSGNRGNGSGGGGNSGGSGSGKGPGKPKDNDKPPKPKKKGGPGKKADD